MSGRVFGLALAVALGCGSSAGAPDAGPDGGGTETPAWCCPIDDTPTCNCRASGGTRGDGRACHGICDAAPGSLVRAIDENGCPYLKAIANASCLGPPPDARSND